MFIAKGGVWATGGSGAISCTLQPALPTGLSFEVSTRVLSGTPGTATAAVTYTCTAMDAAADTANALLRFRIAVVPPPLSFGGQTIGNQTCATGVPVTPLTLPAATGGMGAESYTLSPVVGGVIDGLSFNPQTRELRGTPTTATAPRAFTYSATDDLQRSISLSFTIAVLADVKLRLRVFLADTDQPGARRNVHACSRWDWRRCCGQYSGGRRGAFRSASIAVSEGASWMIHADWLFSGLGACSRKPAEWLVFRNTVTVRV